MRRRLLLACALLTAAAPAYAQTFALSDVSAGYVFLNDPQTETEFPRGAMGSIGVAAGGPVTIVGEAAFSRAHVSGFASDTDLSFVSVMGGARASVRAGPLREMFQVLAGPVFASGTRFGVTETNRGLGIQPGAGVDVPLGGRWWLRGEIDLRYVTKQQNGDSAQRQLRAVAALVYSRDNR